MLCLLWLQVCWAAVVLLLSKSCCVCCDFRCVELLLHHTDQSVLAKCYTSVFNFASMHESTQCTECLVKAGVDVNARHQLPNDDEFVPKLLRYIENDVTYSQALSPLATIALYENKLSSAEVLLSHGANPNACSPDEVPPLLAALNTGNLDLAELLVSHGASVNVYHPHITGNLTLILCLHFWRGLTLMLKCGAEARSWLVDTRHPEDKSVDQRDHNTTVVSFLQTVFGAKHLMSRAGLSTGQVFYRLLQFVGPITLNPCVEQVLDSGTEWDSITQLIGGWITAILNISYYISLTNISGMFICNFRPVHDVWQKLWKHFLSLQINDNSVKSAWLRHPWMIWDS